MKKKISLYEYLIIGLYFIVVLFNVVTYHFCVGVNTDAIFISVVSLCFAIVIIIFKTRIHSKKVIIYISVVLLIATSIVTFISLPKYSYEKAKTLIVHDLSEQYNNVEVIDIDIKNIKSLSKLNFFVDRMYLIKINYEKKEVFYYFNPITGDYGISNFSELD